MLNDIINERIISLFFIIFGIIESVAIALILSIKNKNKIKQSFGWSFAAIIISIAITYLLATLISPYFIDYKREARIELFNKCNKFITKIDKLIKITNEEYVGYLKQPNIDKIEKWSKEEKNVIEALDKNNPPTFLGLVLSGIERNELVRDAEQLLYEVEGKSLFSYNVIRILYDIVQFIKSPWKMVTYLRVDSSSPFGGEYENKPAKFRKEIKKLEVALGSLYIETKKELDQDINLMQLIKIVPEKSITVDLTKLRYGIDISMSYDLEDLIELSKQNKLNISLITTTDIERGITELEKVGETTYIIDNNYNLFKDDLFILIAYNKELLEKKGKLLFVFGTNSCLIADMEGNKYNGWAFTPPNAKLFFDKDQGWFAVWE